MRIIIIPLCLLSASSLRVCGSEENKDKAAIGAAAEVNAEATGVANAKASLAVPRIGGTVVAAGDFGVEVLLHKSGLVEALVTDTKGQAVNADIKLAIAAQSSAGASTKIELGFAPPRGRFEGRAGAGIELAPGLVEVFLDAKGKALNAKFAGVIVPGARLGGAVLVAGGFSSELFVRPSGEVQAFVRNGAGVDVAGTVAAAFKVRAQTKAGATEEIALAFDAPRACFAGKAKAGVELAPGPLEFVATAGAAVNVGRLESVSLAVDATHGGQIIVAGDYTLELVARGPELKAFVFDASGKAHAAGDLDLKLDVGADARTKLGLKWDAGCLCYQGRVDGNLDLALQPLRVAISAGGKAFVGAVASLKAAADAKLDMNAKLAANAKLDSDIDAKAGINAKLDPKVSIKAPDLKASAKASADKAVNAAAKVNVAPPKIDVKVNKSASASTGTKSGAKASAGFSFGTK